MQEIGYFDEDTFLFEEETILGWKLRNANKKVCVVKEANVLHENSVSIKKSIKSQRKTRKILLDSEMVYLLNYLKCDKVQSTIYRFIYHLAGIEREIVSLLKN